MGSCGNDADAFLPLAVKIKSFELLYIRGAIALGIEFDLTPDAVGIYNLTDFEKLFFHNISG